MTISDCLNLGSLRHDSRCSATIHQNEKTWLQEQVTTRSRNISPEERSNMSKRFTAQSHTEVGRRTNTIGSCEREQRGIHSIPGDPDYEEIVKNAIRKNGNTKSLSDAVQSKPHQPTRTFQARDDTVQVIGQKWTRKGCTLHLPRKIMRR